MHRVVEEQVRAGRSATARTGAAPESTSCGVCRVSVKPGRCPPIGPAATRSRSRRSSPISSSNATRRGDRSPAGREYRTFRSSIGCEPADPRRPPGVRIRLVGSGAEPARRGEVGPVGRGGRRPAARCSPQPGARATSTSPDRRPGPAVGDVDEQSAVGGPGADADHDPVVPVADLEHPVHQPVQAALPPALVRRRPGRPSPPVSSGLASSNDPRRRGRCPSAPATARAGARRPASPNSAQPASAPVEGRRPER